MRGTIEEEVADTYSYFMWSRFRLGAKVLHFIGGTHRICTYSDVYTVLFCFLHTSLYLWTPLLHKKLYCCSWMDSIGSEMHVACITHNPFNFWTNPWFSVNFESQEGYRNRVQCILQCSFDKSNVQITVNFWLCASQCEVRTAVQWFEIECNGVNNNPIADTHGRVDDKLGLLPSTLLP